MNAGGVEIAAQFAVDADQHIEIEARGDAGGIVVGLIQHALVLFEIDADHHLRIFSQNVAGAAQETAGLMRFEIPQRRPREKSHLRHRLDRVRQCERRGEVGRDRIDVEIGEILAQGVGLRFEEIAGNIHRNVGAERAFVQQQPDLGGGAGAEFHQRGALRDDGRYLAAPIAQDGELGAGRIIFRQHRDLLEQLRTGGVIEIFRRQPLGVLRQIVDHVAGKCGGWFIEAVRFGQSGGVHIHDSLLNALFRRD